MKPPQLESVEREVGLLEMLSTDISRLELHVDQPGTHFHVG